MKILHKIKLEMQTPTPININSLWNIGSILAVILVTQIVTGFILSMNYCPNVELAFSSTLEGMNNFSNGWLIRSLHMNGASMYFMLMYTHMLRGMYYGSWTKPMVWFVGVSIFIISMLTAFLGYVLPWGQMSYWAATVITNLLSTIPYMGTLIVEWIWGGPTINNCTLNRFYSLHFILPFGILGLVLAHLIALHNVGSSNPLGTSSKLLMIPLDPYFMYKDYIGFSLIFLFLSFMSMTNPYYFGDPDNFIPANPMMTPPHIKPEWYFLYAYSILRAVPHKSGGVLALMSAVLILYTMPIYKPLILTPLDLNMAFKFNFNMLLTSVVILSWTGGSPVEVPFTFISQIGTLMFFSFFIMNYPILLFSFKQLSKKIN